MKRMALILAVIVGACGMAAWQAADQPEDRAQDMGARLIEGLKKTEGCLGVEAGQFRGGKNTIIAWFENKEAVERWYYSPMHQFMMNAMGGAEDRKPLEHVTDPKVPVMVMATITLSDTPVVPGPVPFSQISIELYTPLPGGAMINGRLAPKEFPVKHFRDLTVSTDR